MICANISQTVYLNYFVDIEILNLEIMTKKTISITSRLTYNGGTKKRHESPNGESMTMENETMSIQDIIRRQAADLVDVDKKASI